MSKTLGGKLVLDDVSGVFEEGKMNLIIGASGTGKSVLVKSIVGLIIPDKGTTHYHDELFQYHSVQLMMRIRRKIGMLFQGGALFDSLNVEENIMFPLNVLSDLDQKQKSDRVNLCLGHVGLEGVNNKRVSELSGGMKKRVGIARAIVNNPRYLICDEPNSGLDPQNSNKIDGLIRTITYELNMTTLVVTHDINSVFSVGDNVMFIFEGKNLWEGDRAQILESNVPQLEDFIFANKVIKERAMALRKGPPSGPPRVSRKKSRRDVYYHLSVKG